MARQMYGPSMPREPFPRRWVDLVAEDEEEERLEQEERVRQQLRQHRALAEEDGREEEKANSGQADIQQVELEELQEQKEQIACGRGLTLPRWSDFLDDGHESWCWEQASEQELSSVAEDSEEEDEDEGG